MRLTRSSIPGYFLLLLSAVALLLCSAGQTGRSFTPVYLVAGAAPESVPAVVAPVGAPVGADGVSSSGESFVSGPDAGDSAAPPLHSVGGAGIPLHRDNHPYAALAAHDGTRLLAGIQRGAGSQKKTVPALPEKFFEPCAPLRRMESVSHFGAILPAKNKPYEAFPFDPRSPCPFFPG